VKVQRILVFSEACLACALFDTIPFMQDKTLVVIPTYDERDNVGPIAQAVHLHAPEACLLFVDDNSPDGTGEELDRMAATDSRIHVLHRPEKAGLGRAYVAGFKWGLENGHTHVFEMDADGSHDPACIPLFLAAARSNDLVLGTRYKGGIRVINWPLHRLLISMGAGKFVKLVTGLPVSDPTGGFKCFTRRVLESMDLDAIESNGYSFQIELSYRAWMMGWRIGEVPIVFEDRRSGYSKLSRAIAREAFRMVFRLAWQNRFRRQPAGDAAAISKLTEIRKRLEAGADVDACISPVLLVDAPAPPRVGRHTGANQHQQKKQEKT
jgi:dolichol-phosphate mannosyltransferase